MTSQPLTESHRPKHLADIVGHDDITDRLQAYVDVYPDDASMPHLLFAGPPGVGKTTAAFCLARGLFGEDWRRYVLDTNASDERGIDVIRGRVKDFARKSSLGEEFNIVLLDEADHLTSAAQAALRRVMEDYESTRFVLICNYPNRIIAPIRDRCSVHRFGRVPDDRVAAHVAKICSIEGIGADKDTFAAIAEQANGSVRAALNIVDRCPVPIEVEHVQDGSGSRAHDIAKAALNGETRDAEKALLGWMRSGTDATEVCRELFDVLDDSGVQDKALYVLGEYEYRILTGCDPELQLRCFLRHLGSVT